MIRPIDRQKLISEYLEAFRKANPDVRAPFVSYAKRAYRFKVKREDEWEPRKYRHRDLQRMIRTLNNGSAS